MMWMTFSWWDSKAGQPWPQSQVTVKPTSTRLVQDIVQLTYA